MKRSKKNISLANGCGFELNDLFDKNAVTLSRRRMVTAGSALLIANVAEYFKMISPAGAYPSSQGLLAGEGNQREWQFCDKCLTMFYNGHQQGRKGVCPAGGAHEPQGFNFVRRQPVAGRDSQFDWRFCSKCFVMYFNGDDGDDNRRHGFQDTAPWSIVKLSSQPMNSIFPTAFYSDCRTTTRPTPVKQTGGFV